MAKLREKIKNKLNGLEDWIEDHGNIVNTGLIVTGIIGGLGIYANYLNRTGNEMANYLTGCREDVRNKLNEPEFEAKLLETVKEIGESED